MPPEDEVFPAKEQPLPAAVSPTADSPRYIADSDLEEGEEDLKEDPTDYPANGGDDGDDEDEASDDDDEDDDDDVKEEEENLALVTLQLLLFQLLSMPHLLRRLSRLRPTSLRPHHHHTLHTALLLGCLFDPRHLYHFLLGKRLIDFLPYHHLHHRPRALRLSIPLPQYAPSPPHARLPGTPPLLPIPLPTPSPSLLLPSTDHRADVRKVCLPPRKRLCFAFSPRFKVGESSSAPTARHAGDFRRDYGFIATLDDEIMQDPERVVGYRITDTWDKMLVDMPGAPAIDKTELGRRMTNFVTTVRQDTYEIYVRLDDAQSERQLVTSQVNMLRKDRRAHARTARLMEAEARLSREAWVRSIDASDLACSEVMALRTQVLAQWSEITELWAADRKRQTQLTETLKPVKTLQTQMTAL
ncbi:hypothetical protein Tco_0584176 [Tanacetum coccineum]